MTMLFPLTLSAQPFATQNIPLLSQPELAPYGLKRVWFHQLGLKTTNGKIHGILLEGGQLLITTSDAKLHVLDSETGQWLWSRTIGTSATPLTEPAVNSRIVAVHNHVAVFVFNRKTGKQLLQIPLSEAASAPCEISENYLYVPMANQTILVYALKEAYASAPVEDIVIGSAPENNDPELKKIVQQFDEAKRLLKTATQEEAEDDTYVLDSTHRIPIISAAFGAISTKPLLLSQFYSWVLDDEEQPTHEVDKNSHQEFITWTTDQGYLFTAKISSLSEKGMEMLYRVDSSGQTFYLDQTRGVQVDRPGNKALPSRPTQSQLYPINELDPEFIDSSDVIVTGGRSAYVFAIDARTGAIQWQYPTQGQMIEPIAVIGRDVYVPTINGVLHSIDLDSGEERWVTKNVKRFVAASKQQVYVLDRRNRLICLNRTTGAPRFVYDIRRFDHCLFNLETDQIFLLTDGGLIQCLRERQFAEAESVPSLRHRINAAELAEAIRGGEIPKLWWVEELNTQNEQSPIGTFSE